MTSRSEQAYCWHFGKELFSGEGEWLELGSFLGALTFPSVEGLRLNPSPAARARKITVFDLFHFSPVMVECVKGTKYEGRFESGEWYRTKYLEIVAPILSYLEVVQADLVKHRYGGAPIEFLLLDVLKYESLVKNVTEQFFPHLIPGVTRLLQQDYLHFYEAWTTLQMFALRHSLHPETVVHDSGSVIFKLVAPIENLPDFPLNSAELDAQWVNDAFAWSRSILPVELYPIVGATETMMHVHRRDFEAAARLDRESTDRGWDDHYEVLRMRAFVRKRFPGVLPT